MEIDESHTHEAFDGPDAPVPVLAVDHHLLVLPKLLGPGPDVAKGNMDGAGNMALLVFLVRPRIEQGEPLHLVKDTGRDLLDPETAQVTQELEENIGTEQA
jgi:hypothetical protein